MMWPLRNNSVRSNHEQWNLFNIIEWSFHGIRKLINYGFLYILCFKFFGDLNWQKMLILLSPVLSNSIQNRYWHSRWFGPFPSSGCLEVFCSGCLHHLRRWDIGYKCCQPGRFSCFDLTNNLVVGFNHAFPLMTCQNLAINGCLHVPTQNFF